MTRFAAIDVETANSSRASVCQIGIVIYENHQAVDQWSSLINPACDFHYRNTQIHGIKKSDVLTAPSLDEVIYDIKKIIGGSVLASYGSLDKSAMSQSIALYELPDLENDWVDVLNVARKTWSSADLKNGHALNEVCAFLSIDLNHHDALSDANAAAQVFVKAQQQTGTLTKDWIRSPLPYPTSAVGTKKRWFPKAIEAVPDANPNGPFFGKSIVFTGDFSLISRSDAIKLAANLGYSNKNSVSRKTDVVVFGEHDPTKVKAEKSTKHLTAEKLLDAGAKLLLISETDFYAFLEKHGVNVISDSL